MFKICLRPWAYGFSRRVKSPRNYCRVWKVMLKPWHQTGKIPLNYVGTKMTWSILHNNTVFRGSSMQCSSRPSCFALVAAIQVMCVCASVFVFRNHSFQALWSFASGIPISKVSGVSQLCWCFYFHLDCQNPPMDDASWSTLTLIFEPANAAVTKLHTDSLCTEYRTYLIPLSWTPLSFADVRILIPDFQQDFGHFSGTSWFLSLVSASLLQLTLGL